MLVEQWLGHKKNLDEGCHQPLRYPKLKTTKDFADTKWNTRKSYEDP
jgi:hypothetical protein